MKKIIFLFLMISLSGYSQYVSPGLEEYIEDFKFEADRRGISSHLVMKSFDSILLVRLDSRYIGLYYRNRRTIYINKTYSFNRYLTRKVVFHEIYHAYMSTEHVCVHCNRIMAQIDHGIICNDKDWQHLLDLFFMKEVLE